MARPEPTGATHEVPPSELFFSTTDAKGVIKLGNSTFERLARYPAEQLIGAPHSIIRHPSMPGGAFRLMWETLEAGRPFCAYVDNLAGDGSCYTVFATITPLGEDYLSVRMRPCREDLLGAARTLYQAVRPGEIEARDAGVSARDAALEGQKHLAGLLAQAGFASYDEFIWVALPAEVIARAETIGGFPSRAAGGTFGEVLQGSGRVHCQLDAWMDHLGKLQHTADALGAGITQMTATIAKSETTAAQFAATSGGGFSPIMLNINVWTAMIGEISTMNRELVAQLDHLRTSCAKGRFLIALALLHNDAMAQFACEAIDGCPGPSDPRVAIEALIAALRQDVANASQELMINAQQATAASEQAELLSDLLQVPTGLIDHWRSTAAADPDPRVSDMIPQVAEVVERGHAEAAALARLAEQCRNIASPLDVGPVEAELCTIRGSFDAAA